MENANKFKVVRDITVLDCSTPYMFEKTKKYISNKYKGLGIADDAMLAKLWENVEVDYANFIYPTVVDLELTKYDTETVKAAFDELGDLRGRSTDNKGEMVSFFDFNKGAGQLPVFIGNNNNRAGYYSLEILANYNSGSDKGTTLYSSIGWIDSRKDEEVAVETLQKGKPFFWSFVNWVKVYIDNSLIFLKSIIGEIYGKLQQGIFGRLEVSAGDINTVIEEDSNRRGTVLKFNFSKNNKDSAYFITYNAKAQSSVKGTRLVFDPTASPYEGLNFSGVQILGTKNGDVLLATGGYASFTNLFHIYAPAATLTEKGAVKMAGKVDALADSATLAQAVERLNTLIAQLKSAGIMSEN